MFDCEHGGRLNIFRGQFLLFSFTHHPHANPFSMYHNLTIKKQPTERAKQISITNKTITHTLHLFIIDS